MDSSILRRYSWSIRQSSLRNEVSQNATSSPLGAWRVQGTRLTSAADSASILSPVSGFEPFTGAILSIRRAEYDIEKKIKALGQSGAAQQMP